MPETTIYGFAPEAEQALPASLRAATLCQAFQITACEHAESIAFPAAGAQPQVTWTGYAERVRSSAAGLAGLGVRRGETVGLMLTNRPEFHWIDTAALHLGAATTSVYNTAPDELIRHVIDDSGARVVITEQKFVEALRPLRLDGSIDHLVVLDATASTRSGTCWSDVVAGANPAFDLDAAIGQVQSGDVAVLIYTSGTTGPPKGVELTHRNILFLLAALQDRFGVPIGASQLSFLPMAHAMARVFDHYLQIGLAFEVTTCPAPQDVGSYLPQVRPSFFASTPRLWEKLRTGLETIIADETDEPQQAAAQTAIERGILRVREHQRQLAEASRAPAETPAKTDEQLADEAILKPYLARIGMDRLRVGVMGGAPVAAELSEFWHATGVPLGEAYGLTECGAGATANPPQRVKFGSVGPPLAGVQLKLADDGEILIKSPGVMTRYRNRPAATADSFDPDGFLKSGDIGTADDDGYIRIIDRKKEIIINKAGKNMSPIYIEAKLTEACSLIGQAVAIGDGRSYNIALITPAPEAIALFAREHGLITDDLGLLLENELVARAITDGVARANEQLSRVEQIKKFKLLPRPWEPASEEMTPTMKLRRKPIAAKYASEIDSLYREATDGERVAAPEFLRYETEGPIVRITIDRPVRRSSPACAAPVPVDMTFSKSRRRYGNVLVGLTRQNVTISKQLQAAAARTIRCDGVTW